MLNNKHLSIVNKHLLHELSGIARSCSNADKIDMSFGVCYNGTNEPLLLETVKQAEFKVLNSEINKNYTSTIGDPQFIAQIEKSYYQSLFKRNSLYSSTMTTLGGSGALRIALESLKKSLHCSRVCYESPAWPHYKTLANSLSMPIKIFKPLAEFSNSDLYLMQFFMVNREDIILLQGPCHNPTGVDLDLSIWESLIKILSRKNCIIILDCAYLGLRNTLLEDLKYIDIASQYCETLIISNSFSKTFTLYNERVGSLTIAGENKKIVATIFGKAASIAEEQYFMPPQHGAVIIQTILNSNELFNGWLNELKIIREKLIYIREKLDIQLSDIIPVANYFSSKNGYYSLLKLSKSQINQLRELFYIFVPDSGRLNLSALTQNNIQYFSAAILTVVTKSNLTTKVQYA